MAEGRIERRLPAILAADVAGYSRLMGADEARTVGDLKAHQAVLLPMVSEFGGRIIDTAGDGILAEFPSVVKAVECAVTIQETMAERNAAIDHARRMQLRIGVNIGDVICDETRIYGDGINVAARLEGIAEPGGVCVSEDAYRQTRGKIDAEFADMGEQQLKNLARPVRVYRVRFDRAAMSAPALALPSKPSISVLPFQNLSGDPDQEYFVDGMVEEITAALSRIRQLFVIARNSSFTYKGRSVDVKQVARELGVRYVLEGSVRKVANRVRVTAQLIDAISGAHVWAERYDRDLSDIFAVQEEIAANVVGIIEPALAEAEQQRVLRKPPERLDTWEAYQRGLWHFHKYAPEENKTALVFFRQAIALDPNFAPGHYGYALALQWDVWHFSTRSYLEVQGAAREEAHIAVSLDDKDAMAHAVLAHMMMWGGEWEAAIAQARTAIVLNPNSAFVISMLGCVLGFGGYRDEALDRLRQAMRASPHDSLTWLWLLWRGVLEFLSRDFVAALQTFGQVIRLRPAYPATYELIAASLAYLGRLDEARDVLEHIPAEQRQRSQERLPWLRPQDYALLIEGLRLAAGAPTGTT